MAITTIGCYRLREPFAVLHQPKTCLFMEVNTMFWKRTIWQILFALVVIVFLAVGGVAIYRVGFTQGAMSDITLPEGNDIYLMPHRMVPHPGYFYPRVGLLGFFPFLLCFGGFFLLMMVFGACRRAWHWKYAGKEQEYWKRRGPGWHWHPHWGPGHPPWGDDQPETESDAPSAEADESES
jgi:hypothetical protein